MHKSGMRLGLLFNLLNLIIVPFVLAADVIQIQRNDTRLELPDQLVFNIQAKSTTPIDRVALRYGSNARTCQEGEALQTLKFEPKAEIDLNWAWEFRRSGSLPLGAEVWWEWEVSDTGGNRLTTTRQTHTILDDRYTWQELSRNNVSVRWVEGDLNFGRFLLDITEQSLNRIGIEAGLRLSEPIQVFVYPSADQLIETILYLPEWTGGVAFPEYNSIIVGIAPDQRDWAKDVIPHELMHLVSGALVFNCTGVAMPTWLNEGLSVYAEHKRTQTDIEDLKKVILAGDLPALRSLSSGFSAFSGEANLAYTQSGEVATYLIETHGPETMSQLIAALSDGTTIDAALTQVYGFDVDGLDLAWRQAVAGEAAPAAATAVPTQVKLTATAIPTLALMNPAGSSASPTPPAVPTSVATLTPTTRPTVQPTAIASNPSSQPSPISNWLIGGGAFILCLGLLGLLGIGAGLLFFITRKREK